MHQKFKKKLGSYEIDPKYTDIIKEVMIYTYDALTKEVRTYEAGAKKQLTVLDSKIEAIEERFTIGEIDHEIYQKFKAKYTKQQKDLQSNLSDATFSSSNLQMAIDKALEISSKLSELWDSGDLLQKKKIQNLMFPSGIGYNKQKDRVQTKRVNTIFSSIPLLSMGLAKIKNGEPININQFSARVTSAGLTLLILTKLRFKNHKKITPQFSKKEASFIFETRL